MGVTADNFERFREVATACAVEDGGAGHGLASFGVDRRQGACIVR